MIKSLKSIALPALGALALAGVAQAQPGMGPNRLPPQGGIGMPPHSDMGAPHGPAMGTLSARDYVMKAGASDLYEKRSSELVLQSRNPGIRSFARDMIRDHATSTNLVKAAAMRSALHPKPPMLEPKQAAMIRDLTRAKGPERDRLYLDQQRTAHNEALMLHQSYSRSGDARPLRMAADKIVPVVEHHIDMLRRM
jgi:putative membrane protein